MPNKNKGAESSTRFYSFILVYQVKSVILMKIHFIYYSIYTVYFLTSIGCFNTFDDEI